MENQPDNNNDDVLKKQDAGYVPLDLRAASLGLGILFAIFSLIVSVWSRFTGFAENFWMIYHDLHPTPFTASDPALGLWEHLAGIIIDFAYAGVDGIIMGASFVFFYNFLTKKTS